MAASRCGLGGCLALLLLAAAGARAPEPGEPTDLRPAHRLGGPAFRHGREIKLLRFTPDGHALVTRGLDGTMYLWDRVTGAQRYQFPTTHPRGVWGPFDLSADGRLLAAFQLVHHRTPRPQMAGSVHVFEVATGRELRQWPTTVVPWHFALSPDGQLLLYTSSKAGDLLGGWQTATGAAAAPWPWPDPGNGPRGTCFLPDGRHLVTLGPGATIRIWDVANRRILRSWSAGPVPPPGAGGKDSTIVAQALSPDGAWLATGDTTGRARLWDVAQGHLLRELAGPLNVIGNLAFSPEGTTLYGGGSAGGHGWTSSLVAWDVATGRVRRVLPTGLGMVASLALAPDGRALALASVQDTVVTLLDPANGQRLIEAPGHRGPVTAVRFSPDGRRLASAGADGAIYLWDTATWRPLRTLERHAGGVGGLAFSADGRRLASWGSLDDTVRIWDTPSGQAWLVIPSRHERQERVIDHLAFTDRDCLLAAVRGNGLTWWDAATGDRRGQWQHDDPQADLDAFSPDGRLVWGQAFLLTFPGLECLPLERPGRGMNPVFAPDGWSFLEVTREGAARLVDRWTGKVRQSWSVRVAADVPSEPSREDRWPSYLAALSPDGRWAVACPRLADWMRRPVTILRWWSTRTGRQVAAVRCHGHPQALAFSPDGRWLVCGNLDGTVHVWEVARILPGPAEPGPAVPLEEAWQDLASADAAAVHAALAALVERGAAVAPWLADKVQPPRVPEANQVRGWIADLASPQFATREATQRQLEEAGEAALPLVRQALAGELTPEARRRLETLAERPGRLLDAASRRTLRALEALERLRAPRLGPVLQRLAAGPAGHRVTEEAVAALFRWQGARGDAPSGR